MSLLVAVLQHHIALEAEVGYAVELHRVARRTVGAAADELPALAAEAHALVRLSEAAAQHRRRADRVLLDHLQPYLT